MQERDIVGQVAVITGALANIKTIEQAASRRSPTEGELKTLDDNKELIIVAATTLVSGLLVDINRIAAALEFVATQHNSSEALFKA